MKVAALVLLALVCSNAHAESIAIFGRSAFEDIANSHSSDALSRGRYAGFANGVFWQVYPGERLIPVMIEGGISQHDLTSPGNTHRRESNFSFYHANIGIGPKVSLGIIHAQAAVGYEHGFDGSHRVSDTQEELRDLNGLYFTVRGYLTVAPFVRLGAEYTRAAGKMAFYSDNSRHYDRGSMGAFVGVAI